MEEEEGEWVRKRDQGRRYRGKEGREREEMKQMEGEKKRRQKECNLWGRGEGDEMQKEQKGGT